MATTTVPEVTKKAAPITLTANAVAKVKEIMTQQNPVPAGLRVGVVGGGCSGFSYSMQFENGAGMMDKTFEMDGLKVFVDADFGHVSERLHRRLRRDSRRGRLQVRKSEREEHLRLRIIVQRLTIISFPKSERPHPG